MKKYLFLLTFLLVFIFPSVVYSAPNDVPGYDASTFPPLPECPYVGDNVGYAMFYYNDTSIGQYPRWDIFYYADMSKISINKNKNGDNQLLNNKSPYIGYTTSLRYDSVLDSYYFSDWHSHAHGSGSNPTASNIIGLVYWSHDLVSYYSGELVYESNPFPIPPVVLAELAGEQLRLIPTLIGGTAQEVLPLGLKVLVIILVISLVVYLLRSWLLRRV